MDTNRMELGMDELAMVNGGGVWDHVLGAAEGVSGGFFAGLFGGLAIAGPAGGVAGMFGGAVVGGVAGGIGGVSGINNVINTTKTVIKIKLADL